MTVLIGIALKSLIVALVTLGLLQLVKSRSAAERSWIAHIGLLALVIMAFAPLVLPEWTLKAPALFGDAPAIAPRLEAAGTTGAAIAPLNIAPAPHSVATQPSSTMHSFDAGAAATALYAVPAALLLIITLLALLRLFALRTRAEVLVDGHWLSALARAQRRMGFKHGTALLTSNELASPISWGLIRPVILLNSRAVEAAAEAEAIIAHELAHVARMDWMKLLLARFATALFWFNPLVWLLAREAHQLREEAADDTVLAADIAETDYAQLLVGVARHECPGLLLGAHGVAPSKSSLARRVARVLDGKSVRGPVARSFGLGAIAGAVVIAAPLAALTIRPAGSTLPGSSAATSGDRAGLSYPAASEIPTDLPRLIAKGVSTSVGTATAAMLPNVARSEALPIRAAAPRNVTVESSNGRTLAKTGDGSAVTVDPQDPYGRHRVVAMSRSGTTVISYDDGDGDDAGARSSANRHPHENAVDAAIEMKAIGLTPEYAAAIRAASPALRDATLNDVVGLRAVGVTPDYVREIVAAGFGGMGASEIQEARAVGLSPDYMRAIRATGVPVTFNDLIELRAMGVHPDDLARIRASGWLTHERTHQARRALNAPPAPRPPQPPAPPSDGG